MSKKAFDNFIQTRFQDRFLLLLVLIVLMLLLPPFLDDYFEIRILLDIFSTAIFIALIFAISSKGSQAIFATILVLPLVITTWSSYFVELTTIGLLTRIFGAFFFAYAVINILRFIFNSKEITRETIFAAIVAYLLMALMWTFIYMILEMLAPGSFVFSDQQYRQEMMRFEYFSFITITTLGYGDITPLTAKASVLAIFEAVVGQIYLVVLVAWLVGMFVSRKSR